MNIEELKEELLNITEGCEDIKQYIAKLEVLLDESKVVIQHYYDAYYYSKNEEVEKYFMQIRDKQKKVLDDIDKVFPF